MNHKAFNRRSFLKGAGSVAIGLPFLEGLPSRSAWAQDNQPVFTFFVAGQCGVVRDKFFPSQGGALTADALTGGNDLATSALASHAENMLFIKGIDYPNPGPRSCGHAEGNVQTLTGLAPGSTGNTAYSAGPSADTLIAEALGDPDPVALYSGAKGYIAERISFKGGGAGQVRPADVNPYILYSKVVGLAQDAPQEPTPTGPATPTMDPIAEELANKRKSVNDLVRTQLQSLMNSPALSLNDRSRLDQHFQAIRDIEVTMGGMGDDMPVGAACSDAGLPMDEYEALASGFRFQGDRMLDYVRLHLQVMAVAFGCNYTRVGTLQWGDGTDGTKYDVPSNSGLGWTFHQLSHRIQSDSAVGNNSTAEQAHHEIDILHMETLAAGFDAFKAHGLEDVAQLIWTNTISDGPSHSTRGVPMIIWGSGGGYLKQGQFIDGGGVQNAKVLNTIMAAATRNAGQTPSIGSGEFDDMKA